jgi:hypothetical protein
VAATEASGGPRPARAGPSQARAAPLGGEARAASFGGGTSSRALLAAAFALPGVVPQAVAQSMPDAGVVSLRYLDYRDWQPGADRMRVESPSFYVMSPFAQQWVGEATVVYDAMSGASPLFYNTLSGASGRGVTDYRTAGDAKVTRYFDRYAIGVGGAYSNERDYRSKAGSLDVRWWTEDRNTVLAFGAAYTRDTINPVNEIVVDAKKTTYDFLFGVTQNLSPDTVLQSNVTYSRGRGYYDDPYKTLDARPDQRRIWAWLTRVNHHLDGPDAVLRTAFRALRDDWGVTSFMLEAQWVQTLPMGFSVTPGLRYYTQSAADFWQDPPFPSGWVPGEDYTADTRLSAFGAFTPSIRIAKAFADGWTADLRVDFYRQRSSWRLGGDGSPGIETFSARWIQAGVTKTF